MYISQVTNEFQTLKKKSDDLLRVLKEKEFKAVMVNVSSPLDPTIRFRDLKSVTLHLFHCSFSVQYVYTALASLVMILSDDKCRVMDSKMRPLWLVFHNQDWLGESIFQIFKNGDGIYILVYIYFIYIYIYIYI